MKNTSKRNTGLRFSSLIILPMVAALLATPALASACTDGTAPAGHMRPGGYCEKSAPDAGSINTMGPVTYNAPPAPAAPVVIPVPLTKHERIKAALRAAYEKHQAEIEAAAQRIRDRINAWRNR